MPSFVPHGYQQRAIDDVIRDPFHALFMDPGLGKTAITLAAFTELRERLDVCKVLVIAPLRVCLSVWPEEIEKWDEFNGLRTTYLGDHITDPDGKAADIYLINPERIGQLFGTRVVVESKAKKKRTVWRPGPWRDWVGRPEMLVIDESTRFKRSSGVRTKTVNRYLDDFGRRIALTGSPVPNGLLDLHGQMLLVDGGAALDPRITYYRKRYFDSELVGRASRKRLTYTLKAGADEQIYDAIAPRVTVLRAEDWLELPEEITTDVPVLIPDKVRGMINSLRKDSIVFEDGLEIMDDGGAHAKERQLVNGVVYTNPPFAKRREWKVVHEQKLLALMDLLDEIGRPAIVAYEFRCERAEILKRLKGRRVGVVGGGLKAGEAMIAIQRWKAGDLDVLLVHPAACGHGLNLQTGGNVVIWFGPPWDLEAYQQLIKRLLRQGQEEDHVLVYHLVGVGTVDRRVVRGLRKKDATQEDVFDALKEDYND